MERGYEVRIERGPTDQERVCVCVEIQDQVKHLLGPVDAHAPGPTMHAALPRSQPLHALQMVRLSSLMLLRLLWKLHVLQGLDGKEKPISPCNVEQKKLGKEIRS